jgi:predicted ATPase
VPASLHDTLMARLDRVPGVKEVAQIGAAIGREFPYELLAAVAPLQQNELHEALARLEEAELVFRRGTPPHATFTFKHALVQDTAYDSMLRSRRQQVHAAVASVLEERFPETAETKPEVLAQHYCEAGLAERCVEYRLRAGQRAAELSANLEAVGHLTKGLEVLSTLPESLQRDELELALQSALGMPLIATKGYAAPETGAAYARGQELCERMGRADRLLPIVYGRWAYNVVAGEHETGRRLAEQFLSLVEGQADTALELVGRRILGMSLLHLGELQAGRSRIEQALRLYDPRRHRSLAFRFGQDQQASGLAFLALVSWLSGFPDQAARTIERALGVLEALNHANSRGYVLVWGAATLAQLRHDVAAVRKHVDEVVALAEEHGLGLWLAYGKVFRGWVLAQQGRQEEGTAELVKALAECQATRTRVHRPYHLSLLAEALHRSGRSEEALGAVDEALAVVEETEERWWEAGLHRLRGDLLLSLSTQNAARAETEYDAAVTTAQRQGARMLELRAAASLARLWRDQGERRKARDLLAPVYGRFTEGFGTSDLVEAKALLDELAPALQAAGETVHRRV